jgi:FkbM family methyltransferase
MQDVCLTNSFTILTGTPKSGFSFLSHCLHLLGIKTADKHSPIRIETIHRLLLQDLGHLPYMAGPLTSGWMQKNGANNAMKKIQSLLLLSELNDSAGNLFLADPFLCRFLSLWSNAFEKEKLSPKFVFLLRHPWEVSMSVAHCHKIDLAKAHLVWLTHTLDTLRQCPDPVLITFDQLIADPVSALTRLGEELHLTWPKDPWSARSSLLNFVQPGLKCHHASNFSEKNKQKFQVYDQMYHEICKGQWSGRIQENLLNQYSMSGSDAFLPKTKGIIHDRRLDPTKQGLVDRLFEVIGQYEKQSVDLHSQIEKITSKPEVSLSAQVVFPSTREGDEFVETIPLIVDEWQRISLAVPEPTFLRDKPIMLMPLNTNGTVVISEMKLVNLISSEVLWVVQTPQDFETLKLSGTVLRIPDLDNFMLLVTGDEPCVKLPLMGKTPDCPVRLEIWMHVCRNQQVLHRSIGRRQHKQRKFSNIVWLASYPRSGNTLLRIILNYNFALKSYSIYNDNNDIGLFFEVSEVVGHQFMNWSLIFGEQNTLKLQAKDFEKLNPLRYKTKNLKLVKTHSTYNEGFAKDKVIYIYRDGRGSLRSFASYKDKFDHNNSPLSELMDTLLCCGDDNFGLWSDHAHSWMQHPKDKILFLKFEDVVSDFNTAFKKIAGFLEIVPVRTDVLSFQEVQAINADFFRKGKKKSWQDLLDDSRNVLFWILNHETMSNLGYDMDQSLICEVLKTNGQEVVYGSPNKIYSIECMMEFDQTLQECAQIINKNIDKLNDFKRLLIGKKLRNFYIQCLDFFKKNAPQDKTYGWINKWNTLLNERIFSYTISQRKIHLFDNGVKVYDEHLIPIQRERYCKRNVHEAEEEDIFVEMIKSIPSNGFFLNIGAAIGYYPILAMILAPSINIYAVEPLERHRKYFSDNIELNGFNLTNFTIYEEGISADGENSKFLDSGYGSSIISDDKKFKNALTIKTITLDNLIKKIGGVINFLQMDVQGFEVNVLSGAQETLKQHNVKSFLIGTHTKDLHQECIFILKKHGYFIHVNRFETIDQPDGILLAMLDK